MMSPNHPMFLWWNFREFYNLKFKKNRNTKGLLTLAGMPKDIYYLFQAFFNPDQTRAAPMRAAALPAVVRAGQRDQGLLELR